MEKKPLEDQKIPLKFAPDGFEGKWQRFWEEKSVYKTPEVQDSRLHGNDIEVKKSYILDMFPYPSAQGLHVGHPEGFTATDIVARYKRMKGEAVMHPMGWDSFGLPAENFAIKQGIHPSETTKKAIENFKRQIKALGFSYDWDKELSTCEPEYYRFTQWLFEFLYKRGLAYHAFAPANWCDSCKTVLANEQVVDGKCERCKNTVIQKEIEQWFFKITDFAERLIKDLDKIDWPASTKTGQINWIGKSEGLKIRFEVLQNEVKNDNLKFEILLQGDSPQVRNLKSKSENINLGKNINEKKFIEVFTTRPDTLFGVTYLVLAPEHRLVPEITSLEQMGLVDDYRRATSLKSNLQRASLDKKKTGVFTGAYVRHPLTGKSIPVYIADYIISTYGTGAIMGVPAHDARDFDFAREMGLPMSVVCLEKGVYNKLTKDIAGKDLSEKLQFLRGLINANAKFQLPQDTENEKLTNQSFIEHLLSYGFKLPYEGYGISVNSGKYNGVESGENISNISKDVISNSTGEVTVNFKLRDWLISRQRYWGSPIPVIYCENCKTTGRGDGRPGEYLVPEEDLPVLLPTDVDFRPTGESPLQRSVQFHTVKCPSCGKPARRESDTMDTFVCSSWYYFAFAFWEKYQKDESRIKNQESRIVNVDKKNLDSKFIIHDSKKINQGNIFEKYKSEIAAWCPIDLYVGGAEHTVLHLLYSRFITKALFDAKLVDFDEPFLKLRHVGMILGLDGQKMSKSRGNVINPDEIVKAYGADTMRLYEMFMGPLSDKKPWDEHGVEGCYRFLRRIYHLMTSIDKQNLSSPNAKLWQLTQELLRDVEKDILEMKFNTAIAKQMSWLNNAIELVNLDVGSDNDGLDKDRFKADKRGYENKTIKDSFKVFLKILAPFAPHLAEEIWFKLKNQESGIMNQESKNERRKVEELSDNYIQNYRSIHLEMWPKVDEDALKTTKTLVFLIEISGKIVDKISFQENDERYQKQSSVEEMVLKMEKISSKLQNTDIGKTVKQYDGETVKNMGIRKIVFIPKKLINFVV